MGNRYDFYVLDNDFYMLKRISNTCFMSTFVKSTMGIIYVYMYIDVYLYVVQDARVVECIRHKSRAQRKFENFLGNFCRGGAQFAGAKWDSGSSSPGQR